MCERTIVVKWRICVAAKSFVRAKFGKWCVLKCSYSCNHLVLANSLTMPRIILSSTLNQRHRTVSEIVHIFYKSKQAKPSPPFSFRIFLDKRFWKTQKTQFQLRRMMLDVFSISKGKSVSGSRITSPKGYFLSKWREYPIEIIFSSRKMIFYSFIENLDLVAIKIQNGIVMIASHHLQNKLNEAFKALTWSLPGKEGFVKLTLSLCIWMSGIWKCWLKRPSPISLLGHIADCQLEHNKSTHLAWPA